MAQKASIYVCLRVFCVVLVVAALAHSTCIDTIHEIQNSQGDRMLMGGHRSIQNPQDDKVVSGIVADVVKEYNLRSNDLRHYQAWQSGIIEAYSQLVNGQNYCVQVTLVSAGCKNTMNDEYCRDGKKITCVVSAYKAFTEKTATINGETLECTESE